jgi:hypothetical protein
MGLNSAESRIWGRERVEDQARLDFGGEVLLRRTKSTESSPQTWARAGNQPLAHAAQLAGSSPDRLAVLSVTFPWGVPRPIRPRQLQHRGAQPDQCDRPNRRRGRVPQPLTVSHSLPP